MLGEGAERVLRNELVSNPNKHGNVELGRGHKGVANEAEGCDKEVTAAAKAELIEACELEEVITKSSAKVSEQFEINAPTKLLLSVLLRLKIGGEGDPLSLRD